VQRFFMRIITSAAHMQDYEWRRLRCAHSLELITIDRSGCTPSLSGYWKPIKPPQANANVHPPFILHPYVIQE